MPVWASGKAAPGVGLSAGQLDKPADIKLHIAEFLYSARQATQMVRTRHQAISIRMPLLRQQGIVFAGQIDQLRWSLGIAQRYFA